MQTLTALMKEFQILGMQSTPPLNAPQGVELDGVAGDEEAALQQQAMDALGGDTGAIDWASLLKRQKQRRGEGGLGVEDELDLGALDGEVDGLMPPAGDAAAPADCPCAHEGGEMPPALPSEVPPALPGEMPPAAGAPPLEDEDEFKFI